MLQHHLQRRNVLANKLLLEVDGVGGHHHPLPLGYGEQGCGEQIGERFPDAGATLDDEVMLVVDGVGYGVEHFLLLRAMLKTSECSGERSIRAEHPVDFELLEVVEVILRTASFGRLKPLCYLLVIQPGRAYRCRGSGMSCRHAGQHREKGPTASPGQLRHIRQQPAVLFPGDSQELYVEFLVGERVVYGTVAALVSMRLFRPDSQFVNQSGKGVSPLKREEDGGEVQGVEGRIDEGQAVRFQKP